MRVIKSRPGCSGQPSNDKRHLSSQGRWVSEALTRGEIEAYGTILFEQQEEQRKVSVQSHRQVRRPGEPWQHSCSAPSGENGVLCPAVVAILLITGCFRSEHNKLFFSLGFARFSLEEASRGWCRLQRLVLVPAFLQPCHSSRVQTQGWWHLSVWGGHATSNSPS